MENEELINTIEFILNKKKKSENNDAFFSKNAFIPLVFTFCEFTWEEELKSVNPTKLVMAGNKFNKIIFNERNSFSVIINKEKFMAADQENRAKMIESYLPNVFMGMLKMSLMLGNKNK
jgi:hypothetical protein